MSCPPLPSGEALRATFDDAPPHTVGIEDEVMLLDCETHELAPRAEEVMSQVDADERFKLELPASQLEIVTRPAATVRSACEQLWAARVELVQRTDGLVRLGAAGVHPFGSGSGEINQLDRYAHTIREYGSVARRQLVCAFQVHVAPGGADRALSVYNVARSYLPLLAALAANAPFYEGQDSGLASVRPKLCDLLPRQGVPPPIQSWEEFAQTLAWGTTAGSFTPGAWWWELRPHRSHGTLEFRVPDGQSSPADAAAIAAVIQSLVVWLGRAHDQGRQVQTVPSWTIAENRWSACRHGVEGQMADLRTGELRPTRTRLHELLDELEPVAQELESGPLLARARMLVERNGAIAQRQVAAAEGVTGLGPWLAQRFLDPLPG